VAARHVVAADLQQETPMTKVSINARGCSVEVEASGAKAADLIQLALDAHEKARDPHLEKAYGPAGFSMEREVKPKGWHSRVEDLPGPF